jgi:DHA1 family multidrug resistance protein-like MFS transporter
LGELSYAILNQSALPPYLEEIGLKAKAGIVIGTFLVVEAIFKSPMGSLGDRLGRRPLIVGGALISCVTAIAVTLIHRLWGLMLLRTLDGVAAAAIWPTMIAAVSGSVPREKRTMAMNAMTVTYLGGVALSLLLGGLANDLTGSKLASFYLVSGLFLATALVAFFLTPHRSKEEMEVLQEEKEALKISDILMGIKTIPDMMLLAFLAFFGIGLLIPIIKYFAMDEFHLSETGFGVLVLPIAGAAAGASLFAGRLGDRWGKARSVRLGIGIAAAGMWIVTFSHAAWELVIAAIFLGVGFVFAMPAWLAYVADISVARLRGTVIGALGTAQGIGAVIGTVLGSYLYTNVAIDTLGMHFTSHYTPFFISALALTLSFGLVLVFIRDGDRRRIGETPAMRVTLP